MNIVETIAKSLGYSDIQKIDPNTQQVTDGAPAHGTNSLGQATIPTVLLGIFDRLNQNQDISWLSTPASSGNWMPAIFGKRSAEVISHINAYTQIKTNSNIHDIEHIAGEAVRVVKENIQGKSDNDITGWAATNRKDVLLYLPASIEMGKILKNENLDDRTNKMEGPISNLMHKLEGAFNSSQNS